MHHVVLDQWGQGRSVLHARDARAKILAALSFLVVVATTPIGLALPAVGYGLFLTGGIIAARLPLGSALLRAAVVLPFSATFAAMSLLAGDAPRAVALLQKSYLSALAVVLLVGTTPMPKLLRGLESLGAPRFLLLVVQFLYRYLFVISEQAQHMRLAASSRGAPSILVMYRKWRLRAAAGALAVLFARSYSKAEGIHRAMVARCFQGHFTLLCAPRFGWTDAVFLLLAALVPVALRLTLGLAG